MVVKHTWLNHRKIVTVLFALLIVTCFSACSSKSDSSVGKKTSVREERWLKACRTASDSVECEDAIAANFAKDTMFYSLSNGIDFEEPLRFATGPHNVWCFTAEGRCYAQIHPFNNSGRSYLNNPTAMIQDGDWKFHYAVLEGSVSFDNSLSSWPLEKDHFFDLNPGQSWRDLGVDEIWRAGFNIKAAKMNNLKELAVGKSSDNGSFSPDGANIPLCKKGNSNSKMIIYEDCRILNEWDYKNGNYQRKPASDSKTKTNSELNNQTSPIAGEPCERKGLKSQANGITFTCIKLGKNLFWNNGTKSAAKANVASQVGEIGPGGGLIFYDAGSQQPWGRYLEVAPEGWSDSETDPTAPTWCEKSNDIPGTLMGIGLGKSNTNKMLANCSSGAAVLVHRYKGGGKEDWYLPSERELNELCKFSLGQATGNTKIECKGSSKINFGFSQVNYWSSSQANPKVEATVEDAYGIQFGKEVTTFVAGKNIQSVRVRPIRSF